MALIWTPYVLNFRGNSQTSIFFFLGERPCSNVVIIGRAIETSQAKVTKYRWPKYRDRNDEKK